MAEEAFLTHEVGSLRKPPFLQKASKHIPLTENDLIEAKQFLELIEKTELEDELTLFLSQISKGLDSAAYQSELNEWRVRLNVGYKESTGIDIIDAGEWLRPEMYQYIVESKALSGIRSLSYVRSFDYNFYKPGVYFSDLSYDGQYPIHLQEFLWAKKHATKPLKICVTAFNTIAEWSYTGSKNFEDFVFDLIDTVYVPEISLLINHGANWIQLDEPALTTHPEHVETFVDAWNYFVSKLPANNDLIFSLHNCFSDYDLLFPILPELNRLGAISLEFANRDSWHLGKENRYAYQAYGKQIKNLYEAETGFNAKIALGVLPVHTDRLTTPELIRDRLLYIADLVGNPELVLGAPDCGLRQRSLPVAHKLLSNLSEGAKLARAEWG